MSPAGDTRAPAPLHEDGEAPAEPAAGALPVRS